MTIGEGMAGMKKNRLYSINLEFNGETEKEALEKFVRFCREEDIEVLEDTFYTIFQVVPDGLGKIYHYACNECSTSSNQYDKPYTKCIKCGSADIVTDPT